MKSCAQQANTPSLPYWLLSGFLTLVFLLGGSARGDVQSLAILRPLSALMLGYGLWGLRPDHIGPLRFLVIFASAVIGLVVIHLIPLPASLWTLLPGRDLTASIDRAAGFGAVWRPISLVPAATWNALYALVTPLAVLVMAIQLTREQRFALLPIVISLGLFSGLIGLLQAIGPPDSPLYLYQITNEGAAVGLFANRNHQAVLLACLFPMLGVFASTGLRSIEQARFWEMLAVGAGAILIPLLLVTGSRAGLITGLIGLASLLLLYRRPTFAQPAKRKISRINPRILIGAAIILGLVLMTILMARAEALDRLLADDNAQNLRFEIWKPIATMAGKYFPFGSGIGSFVEVFQIDEPYSQLSPTYLNHAHNDWIETLLTSGLAGTLLLLTAVIAWSRLSLAYLRAPARGQRGLIFGKLGAVLIFIVALASISDYPLRTPSMACVLILAAVWMASGFETMLGRRHN